MQKNNALIPIVCFLFFTYSSFAQMEFSEHFYGEPSHADYFNDLQATPDGGYIAVGQTQETGKSGDIFLVKFAADGTPIFTENFGTENLDEANAVVVLNDRYVIGGSTFSEITKTNNSYLLSVDLDGELINEISFGEAGEDIIYSMTVLSNGLVAVLSTYENAVTGADINLRLYDENLDLQEETEYVSELLDFADFIIESEPGGDILVSGYQKNGVRDGLILSFSNDLSTLNWELIANTNDTLPHQFFAGIVYDDENYVFVAETLGNMDSQLMLVDKENGTLTNGFPITGFEFSAAQDIFRKDDIIYILGQDNRSYLLPFDVINNSFGEEYKVPNHHYGNAMTLQNGKIGIAGFGDVDNIIDANIRQIDLNFSEEWSETLGDTTPETIYEGLAFSEAPDGGFYLTGNLDNQANDVNVKKIDSLGVVLWETNFGLNGLDETTWAITTAIDGGCVVVYDMDNFVRKVSKLDANGNLEWTFSIDGFQSTLYRFGNITTGTNGNFYYAYTVYVAADWNAKIVCISPNGEQLWQNTYRIDNIETYAYNIKTAANGDLLIACSVDIGGLVPGILRVNPDGELIWDCFYEIAEPNSRFMGITESPNGEIFGVGIISPTFQNSLTSQQGIIFRLNDDGTIINSQITEEGNYARAIYDVAFGVESGLHTVSYINEKLPNNILAPFHRSLTTRIETIGQDLEVLETFEFGLGLSPIVYRMLSLSNGGLAAFGSATIDNNRHQYLILIDAEAVNSTIEIQLQGTLKLLPTVSDGNFSIDFNSPHTGDLAVKIYNSNGQIVHEFTDKKGGEKWLKNVNLPDLAAGNYFINIRLGEFGWTRQMMKQ